MNPPSPHDLFLEALEKSAPGERTAFLDGACRGDVDLRTAVEELLAKHIVESSLQDTVSSQPTVVSTPAERPGESIGRYKLLQEIGEGGFGKVWMAEQMEPVVRRVALKILKLGMDTHEVIARFEAERQALAMMDHPNIAKIFDAGATDKGRPFFVMELVKGLPITQFCDEQGLGMAERLALFGDVCSAINHAHQKGVIHRDIKPSNVMVTLLGDKPVVKVIDFGIAKATQGALTDKTIFTRVEQFIGTPVYMSPEQASMSGLDVDTRSDIYALGILLYELLTGKPPFDAKSLAAASYEEMRRIIREVEPPKPSSRLSTIAGDERTQLAKMRHIAPEKLKHLIEPDLDWIVMKAIEKDRARRYETANGFAMDIQRFLADEPVSARPPSAGYQFRKFARRNKTALRVATAIAVVLVAATAVSIWQAIRATTAEKKTAAERDAKELARQDAEAISTFLTEVFQSPDPTRNRRTITVADALGTAAKKLDTDLATQPARRARLQGTLGSTYLALGFAREAIPLHEKARDYHLAAFGLEHPNTIATMSNLATSYFAAGRREEASKLKEEVLALFRKVQGPEHPHTLSAMSNVAISYSDAGRKAEALRMQEEVLTLSRKLHGPDHPVTLVAMSNLSSSYFDAVRKDEALKLREDVLALRRKVLGQEHPDTLAAMSSVAHSFFAAGRYDAAIKMQEEVLPLRRKVSGPEHPDTLDAMTNLAVSYIATSRPDEAIKMLEETLALSRKANGPEHSDTLKAMSVLASAYRAAGRIPEVIALQEELLPLSRKVLGPEHPDTIGEMMLLALSYRLAGRIPEAIALQEPSLAIMRRVLPPKHPYLGLALSNMAKLYEMTDRKEEAATLRAELADRGEDTPPSPEPEPVAEPEIAMEEPAKPMQKKPPVPGTLIAPDSDWKWRHPTDGKDPAESTPGFHTAFFLPDFDDSTWKTGQDSDEPDGGFGYGLSFHGLSIGKPEGMKYRRTAYFRHAFTTDKPHSNLELRCRRDDGIIVYLDGKEILRDNTEAGPDAWQLPAKTAIGPGDDSAVQHFQVPGTLAAGKHLLAISVHNTAQPSTDLRLGGVTLLEVKPAPKGR